MQIKKYHLNGIGWKYDKENQDKRYTKMTKRVYLTLADKVYDALERWAEDQGRPVANLGAYLVEKCVEEAEAEGKIPPSSQKKVKS